MMVAMTDSQERKRVLIVEDHPDNRTLASKVLARAGYEPIAVDRAEGLIQIMDDAQPSLVLMDIELPGITGFDALKLIRTDSRFSQIPIIAFTAYAMPEDQEKCRKAGFDDYMSKPFDIDLLVEKVNGFLGDVL